MTKSKKILKSIRILMALGKPPSIVKHVFKTSSAKNASMASPMLSQELATCSLRSSEGATYTGMRAMTVPQPKCTPKKVKRHMSSRYARPLTLVKTLASWAERPGGRAFFRFFVLDLLGFPSSLVAGTVSKYGSWRER
jgi:hypothetical protein